MPARHTIARDVSTRGIGLHSGVVSELRLIPAAVETGVVFVRRDAGGIEIPATLEYAGPSYYATVLLRDGVSVTTIEHLMAALYAMQVDDVRVELDGPEVPILDGSSLPFVDLIAAAGRTPLDRPREYMTLVRPIVVAREDKRIAAYPCAEYRVTYGIEFDHPHLAYQELTASLWGEGVFRDKLAPARTFTFERDVPALRRRGLALGGSLENAVVIADSGPLNRELRFPDEFVRHKMLDLTGDLSLLGRPLCAHIVALRAGHDLHASLARTIWHARDAWYLTPQPQAAHGAS